MLLQIAHPVAQADDVGDQLAAFGADEVGLLAHARILADGLHHLHRQHQQGRRDQNDARAEGALDHVVEMLVQLGIDGFRGHEHQRDVLRLAADEVAFGDVGDVLGDIALQPRLGLPAFFRRLRLAEGGDGFQREFGIDQQRALVARQEDGAVGAPGIRQRVLEGEAVARQAIGDDRLQPALAERAARLLVRERLAQAHHLTGQFAQTYPRLLDHGEALVQFGEVLVRCLAGAREALAHAVGGSVEPLGDGAGELALALRQHLGHGLYAADGLRLGLGERGEPFLKLIGAPRLLVRLCRVLLRPARDGPQHGEQQKEAERRRADGRLCQRDVITAQNEQDLIHPRTSSRFGGAGEQKVNSLPPRRGTGA